jgi:hypothetical protein
VRWLQLLQVDAVAVCPLLWQLWCVRRTRMHVGVESSSRQTWVQGPCRSALAVGVDEGKLRMEHKLVMDVSHGK